MEERVKILGKKYIETGLLTQRELADELKVSPQLLNQVLRRCNINLDHKYVAMLEVESEGYRLLLGKDKINSVGETFYVQCPLGHLYKTNLTEWRRGRRCQECASERLNIARERTIEVNSYTYIHRDDIIEIGVVLDGTLDLYIKRSDPKLLKVTEGTLNDWRKVIQRIKEDHSIEIIDDSTIDKIRSDSLLLKFKE